MDTKMYSRSYDADTAFPLRVAETLDPSCTLIKGGETSTKIGRIATVCGHTRKIEHRFDIEQAKSCIRIGGTSSHEIDDRADIKTSRLHCQCDVLKRHHTYQQASQPDGPRSPWEPRPNGTWSRPSYSRCNPCPWSTRTTWFLPKQRLVNYFNHFVKH